MQLVSIVVVTYNSGKTITETLNSIYNQTYSELELIVSDDCSTDNTVDIIRKWLRKKQNRFVAAKFLIARKNHGVTKNCNIAINQVHGKYVQIIAGDDILLENAIEKKYNFAEKKSLKLVCSKVETFGTNIHTQAVMEGLCQRCFKIMKSEWKEQYENILKFNFVIGPMCSFYLTEYFRQSGGYDIRYPMLEDYPFIFRYIVRGNKIILLDEVLTKYRISNMSLSIGKSSAFRNSVKRFICFEILKELIKHKRWKQIKSKIGEVLNN